MKSFIRRLPQKMAGLLLILVTVMVIRWLGIQENGLYNGDIAFITFPIALWLMFTKKIVVW